MSEFDIRSSVQHVESIRFANDRNVNLNIVASVIRKSNHFDGVIITDEDYDENDRCEGFVIVPDKEHAENLIKAIQKAFELDWL